MDSDADGDLRAAVLPVEREGGDAADSNTCVQFDTTTTLVIGAVERKRDKHQFRF